MNGLTTSGTGTPPESLHTELRALIATSRQRLASAVNAELTRLYWTVGQRLASEVLGGERAGYGVRLLDQLGQQLSQEFGRGFESRNLRRMVKFAQAFPDAAIVSTLSTQLSWSHLVAIVALKSPESRAYYAQRAAQDGWSVRELNHQIERKAFERTEIAASQSPAPPATPAQVFKDPYFLDFLGLRQGHDEADLEAAILRQLEAFILELGRGFAFVERQKRLVIDGEDPAVLPPPTAPPGGHRTQARPLQSRAQGPDGAVPQVAGQTRTPGGRGSAHRPNPVRRIQPRAGGAAANAQGRHHRGRVLDGAAAQGGTGAAAACGAGGSAGEVGAAGGVVGGGNG